MTDVFPEEMIRYAITMFERAGQKSRKGYAEADKNPKTEYGLEQLKKGNIYSTFEILFSMVGVTGLIYVTDTRNSRIQLLEIMN